MGRKKIAIARIQDERNRQITFSKRKAGLLKKAYELSILCDVEIAVIMITSNNKLYQYASTNMNSILIRYTEFKDPDESKTNADIHEDITKKEKGASAHDDSGEEEDSANFLLTPRTQAHYRRIDEEFDQILRHQQLTAMPAAPLSAPTPSVPQAMPVRVPVTHSPSTIHQQIQQHLQQQLEQQQRSASSSLALSSASSGASLISPPSATPSDQSSASPGSLIRGQGQKSPGNMPPPLNTPTRLQTLRNQTLKLHLPGSGRNYIALGPGGSPGKKSGGGSGNDSDGEEGEGETGGGAGGKPHLRVVIPGQKEFVPRTQSTSPLPQVAFNAATSSTLAGITQATTNPDSLTTPILSLQTPNLFSSLPPLFSSFMGEFPFGPSSAGGGGGTGDAPSALVAFPVSIQPSAVSGSSSATSNIILQAQNMGQPFLLTPSYDLGRGAGTAAVAAATTNPLFTSQSYTPPTSLTGISPGPRPDLEQLKLQYDRLQQQLLQQQLLLQHHHQQQQQAVGGGGGGGSGRGGASAQTGRDVSQSQSQSQETDSEGAEGNQLVSQDQEASPDLRSRFINASDVLISAQSGTATLPTGGIDSRPSPSKRPRIDS